MRHTFFSMMLRERSPTLLIMQDDAIDIEGNMTTSGKNKLKIDYIDKEKNKVKDEAGPSYSNKESHRAKIEDMSKLIMSLSNKLSRMEIEGYPPNKAPNEEGPQNPKQFRRPFTSQMFRRDKRNEEQPLTRPPVKKTTIIKI
jgi:hypothetical protein